MTTTSSITTAQQLFEAGDIGRCELVRGELVTMTPAGSPHGRFQNRLAFFITQHADAGRLGDVYGAETGYMLGHNPDTVRAPDVSFLRAGRRVHEPAQGYYEGAPDLAVEVLSPTDRAGEVLAKVQDWLGARCRLVWVVDPKRRTVACYSADGRVRVAGPEDHLTTGDVLPGFDLVVARIFE